MGIYVKIFIKLVLIFENFHWELCQDIYEIIFSFVTSASEIVFYTLTLEKFLNHYVKLLIRLT